MHRNSKHFGKGAIADLLGLAPGVERLRALELVKYSSTREVVVVSEVYILYAL